jgi:hypothetical protein
MQTKSIAVVVAALALGLPARADPVVVVNSGSQSTLVPLSPSSPGATGTSTIIPINVTATNPLGLTDPLLGQLGLTDPLLGQPSSVVPLPDVIVTGGISGTTAPADGSGLYSYTASVGSPVSVPLNVDLPTTMSVFDTASTSVASAVVGVTTPPSLPSLSAPLSPVIVHLPAAPSPRWSLSRPWRRQVAITRLSVCHLHHRRHCRRRSLRQRRRSWSIRPNRRTRRKARRRYQVRSSAPGCPA